MLNTVLTVIPVISTVFVLVLAWRFFHTAPPWLDEKIESTIGVFLQPDKDGVSMMDHLGQNLGMSIKAGLMGQRSGQVRHGKMIEKRVFEAVKENIPEVKIGLKLAEKFGLGDLVEDPADAYAVMQVLKNRFGIDAASFLKGGAGSNPANSPQNQNYGGKM